jgi:hypothetical protein
MFFKDDKGIDVIQMGTGDVRVCEIGYPNNSKLVGIGFGEAEEGKINRKLGGSGKFDYEVGIKLKLTFTNTKSIDVVINALKKAKKSYT